MNAAPLSAIKTITPLFDNLPAGKCLEAVRGLSESNLASASLLNAIAPFLATNMQAKINKKTFTEGSPFAAASIEASAKGSAKSVWLKRTNFAYSVIFANGIAGKVEISILRLRLKRHKMRNVVFFFLVFFGIAFSQDSTTTAIDTTLKATPVDTAFNDTASKAAPVKATPKDTASKDSTKIKPGLHFFVSAGAHFITFKERSKFQTLLISEFKKYEDDYNEYKDSGNYSLPVRQDFETVNLTFPISAGIMWQFSDVHSLGLGVGFLYNTESVILTDKDDKIHNFKYTIQAFPAFAEYRLLISPKLISLRGNDYFSLFLRYYWLFPPTEIKSSWGNAKADFEPLGSGYGIFLGYRFWEWMGLSIFGEMGLVSLDAKSSSEDRILDSWNLGGISILIRALF
jgi:hypothetical protein